MCSLPGNLFDTPALLNAIPKKKLVRFKSGDVIFCAGDPNDYVYYVKAGRIKVSVLSSSGREAIVALLNSGQFLGESALMDLPARIAGAICLTDCQLWRIEKEQVLNLLRVDKQFSESFLRHLLERNRRYEEDLADRTLHCSEKRLARALLLIAGLGGVEKSKTVPAISHETLAELVGTTRARVSQFMKSFREQKLIEYDRQRLTVNQRLLDVLLRN